VTAAPAFRQAPDAAIKNKEASILSGCGCDIHLRPKPLGRGDRHPQRCRNEVPGIAVSSYQGGHVRYSRHDRPVRSRGGELDIKVFGGGGGL